MIIRSRCDARAKRFTERERRQTPTRFSTPPGCLCTRKPPLCRRALRRAAPIFPKLWILANRMPARSQPPLRTPRCRIRTPASRPGLPRPRRLLVRVPAGRLPARLPQRAERERGRTLGRTPGARGGGPGGGGVGGGAGRQAAGAAAAARGAEAGQDAGQDAGGADGQPSWLDLVRKQGFENVESEEDARQRLLDAYQQGRGRLG